MKISIKSTNDVLIIDLWLWFLRSLGLTHHDPDSPTYESTRYSFHFFRMREYWEELGKREATINLLRASNQVQTRALSTEELIQIAFAAETGPSQGVVLFNMSQEGASRLADQLPSLGRKLLEEDFIFLRVGTREAATKVLTKIPSVYAYAVALDRGLIFDRNY